VLVDSGLVEIFTDDGRAAATSDLALDAVKRVTMTARADAGCTVEVLVIE
jgi:hypothetical protein